MSVVPPEILELIRPNEEVLAVYDIFGIFKSKDSRQQISIVLTMKKLYILKKDNLNKLILEIPADEIILINYQLKIKKSILTCKSHLIGVLSVVDNKKKIFEVTVENIPLQNFEKPFYKIKKELENITGKNWQIIQLAHEIILKRTDINEKEFLTDVVENTNTPLTKQPLTKTVDTTDSSNLRGSPVSGLIDTLWEVFSNPTIQKGLIYFTLGIIAIIIIYSLAEQIITVMLLVLMIYAFFKYLQHKDED